MEEKGPVKERWLGVSATGTEVLAIGIEWDDSTGSGKVIEERPHPVPKGQTAEAYLQIFQRLEALANTFNEGAALRVAVVASRATGRTATSAILRSAEVRGVVIAALARSGVVVTEVDPATSAKILGNSKTWTQIVDDPDYWAESLSKQITKRYRPPALAVLIARRQIETS